MRRVRFICRWPGVVYMDNLSTKEILLYVMLTVSWLWTMSWFRKRIRTRLAAQGQLEAAEKKRWISTVISGVMCLVVFLYVRFTLAEIDERIFAGGIALGLGIIGYGIYQRWKAGQQ